MKRRNFARSLCVSVATVSGCAAFGRSDAVRIGLAEIANLDELSGHEVHVQFREGENIVYDEHHQLTKNTESVPPTVVVDDELPDEQGQYELRVTLDSKSEPERMDVTTMTDGDCTNVIVLIRNDSWVGLTATEHCYDDAADEATVS